MTPHRPPHTHLPHFQVCSGEALLAAGSTGPLWRVTQGAFRLDRPNRDGSTFVQLALVGDLVGVEGLCAAPYTCTATALMDSQAGMEPVGSEINRYKLLAQGFLQQQRRALDTVQLRSGPIGGRVGHLLKLLGRQADGSVVALARKALPSLSELALIVDSTPETVCRELKAFLPARPRQRRAPSVWQTAPALGTAA